MKKLSISLLSLALLFTYGSCTRQADEGNTEESELTEADTTDASNNRITVTATEFPEYPDAKLTLNAPAEGEPIKSGTVRFSSEVENYKLGAQTENAENLMLANSDQGQHIHLIVDNDPYTAHYEPVFERELSEGNHVVLAFLSRSFHASLKNEDAYVLRKYTVGNTNSNDTLDFDLDAPHMFYSRPKGTYAGDDAQKILLDFYLVNTELSANGNKVRATVNGREFMLEEWKPYIIEGAPMGQVTIKLELLDENDSLIDSPYNPVTRTITLEEESPQ